MRGCGPDASSVPRELLSANHLKYMTRCLVGGFGFRVICLLPVDWSIWAASALLQNPGACSRALCSCVTVGMCPSHAELGVLVDDTVVRRLGWSGANESDDYVRQNYNN